MKQRIKHLFLLFLILLSSNCFAQQIEIQVTGSSGKSFLSELSGENILDIDSISWSFGGYKFTLDKNKYHTGVYRLAFSKNNWLDFIYDNEDVEITTEANNILDYLKVLKSESNKIYYEFVRLNKDYKTKTELLQLILARYPKEDDYYQITKEKLIQILEDYKYFVNVTAQANPKSFIARYVRTAQLPIVNVEIPFDKRLAYLKSHSLDNVNFNDDGLIYSDAFTNKTIEYLTYYRNPQLPLGLLEQEFMKAIDSVLSKAKVNEIVYKHIVEYLLDGFKKFGFDNVINYIIENYVIKDEICLDEKLETAIERRIQQSRNFKEGSAVPNVILPDSTGSQINLSKLTAEKTLIIFYASWCPHCQTLLPQIYDLYKNQKEQKFEVLAVSIDTSRTDWLKFIQDNKLDWLNISDLKGWSGKTVNDYFIYATPTMFLVDQQKKVIKMVMNLEEIVLGFKK